MGSLHRIKALVASSLLLAVGWTGCSTSPTGGSPTPTPTATPTPSPTPGSSADTFRLNIEMRSGTGDLRGMKVRVMVDNVAYTRASAPYNDGTIAKGSFDSDEDPQTFPLDVPAGKTVTLIAVEAIGTLGNAVGQEDPENFSSPYQVEFVTWEGDDETRPESGVATLVMDGDKNVSAVFAQMPRVIIRKYDENNAQLSGGCYKLEVTPAERLALPGDGDLSVSGEDLCCCNAAGSDIFILGHVKTGSQIKLTASDSNICDSVSMTCLENFKEWTGSAALCGSARECTQTVGVDVDLAGVWRDNSQ